ncbi:unnamed protein product, partial [Symbiodinium pilosum]
ESPNWSGDLILYVTDSDNVRSWLTKRRPRNPFARLMICLVQRLEAEYNFSCHAVYIRTYHTEMADWISRTPVDEVTSSMMARGWAKVDCLEFWETLLIGATHTAMVLLGGDPLRQKARQLALPVSTLPAPLRDPDRLSPSSPAPNTAAAPVPDPTSAGAEESRTHPPARTEEPADSDEGLEEIVIEKERDEDGRYVYHPSFVDPGRDVLTAQDRADLAVLRETYDRIANSAVLEAEPAATAKGRGKRPRYPPGSLRPSAVTARADPKYQQDLDAGLTSQDAFKRHKSRFTALAARNESG